jgi:hypothetical protein
MMPTALGNHDATLQENGAELVDQGCPLADRAASGTMQDLGSLARRPSRPAGPFPKMVRKLSLELLQDTDGKLHLHQTLRCRLSISLIGLPFFAKGPEFISAQRIHESRETIAVPDAQQDAIHRYVFHS